MVCPEKQILSVYYDGELPDCFAEKVMLHIDCCDRCREILEGFRKISEGLEPESVRRGVSVMVKAKDRVRERMFDAPVNARKRARNRSGFMLFRRSVSVPVPFAAAASLLVIFAFFMLFYELRSARRENNFLLSGAPYAGSDIKDEALDYYLSNQDFSGGGTGEFMIPASDMNEVIEYLERADNGSYIRLPERKEFRRYGEPKLIFAGDRPGRR